MLPHLPWCPSWCLLCPVPLCLNINPIPCSAPSSLLPQVFRAAVDLKQRRLVTECLLLLLPQFGRSTSDSTGEARLGSAVGCKAGHRSLHAARLPICPIASVAAAPVAQHCCHPLPLPAVSEVIDYMDATLSKVVLTQVRLASTLCV